jgi:RNA-binding protein
MNRVGEVVRVAQGVAVVRSDDDSHPSIGADVIDESLDDVGRVVDVFGPVERPYLAVTPADDPHLPGLVGTVLYAR